MTATTIVAASAVRPLEYQDHPWGEMIHGTKAQIQSLGIGVGLAFPGEPSAKPRRITVVDPRGLKTTIEPRQSGDRFAVSIYFEGRYRPRLFNERQPFAPGVCRFIFGGFDSYEGTGEALVAAGLVRSEHLPGQPGMGKVTSRVSASGTILRGRTTYEQSREVGSRSIYQVSRLLYRVNVTFSDDERSQRTAMWRAHLAEWEAKMQALPRPAHLVASMTMDSEAGNIMDAIEVEIANAEERKAAAELAALPATRKQFAEKAGAVFWKAFDVFFRSCCSEKAGESGYRFCADDIERFRDGATDLYWEIAEAEALFDRSQRGKTLREARARAAKLNPTLQRLLTVAAANRIDTTEAKMNIPKAMPSFGAFLAAVTSPQAAETVGDDVHPDFEITREFDVLCIAYKGAWTVDTARSANAAIVQCLTRKPAFAVAIDLRASTFKVGLGDLDAWTEAERETLKWNLPAAYLVEDRTADRLTSLHCGDLCNMGMRRIQDFKYERAFRWLDDLTKEKWNWRTGAPA